MEHENKPIIYSYKLAAGKCRRADLLQGKLYKYALDPMTKAQVVQFVANKKMCAKNAVKIDGDGCILLNGYRTGIKTIKILDMYIIYEE